MAWFAAAILAGVAVRSSSGRVVTLPFGSINGNALSEVDEYLGVPFAAKAKRFTPAAPWTEKYPGGHLKATKYSAMCMQLPNDILPLSGDISEDCLYLNVYSPRLAPPEASGWPVMVWIHGGALVVGTAMDPNYNATRLVARENLVVALLNYRLGVFGFGPVRTREGTYTTNLGFRDQQEGLKWVRQHIAAFRGDAKSVTIFGESAGGGSTGTHVISLGSAGLFDRAISESGDITNVNSLASSLEAVGNVSLIVGCSGSVDEECLHNVNAGVLLASTDTSNTSSWKITVDGYVFDDQPVELIHRGLFNRVPFLLGTNRDEGNLFFMAPGSSLPKPKVSKAAVECIFLQGFGEAVGRELLELYAPVEGIDNVQLIADMFGDRIFHCDTRAVARALTSAGAAPWVYSFRRHSKCTAFPGVAHMAEIPYVFLARGDDSLNCSYGLPDLKLQALIADMWAGFARTGSLPEAWPRWSRPPREPVLKLDLGSLSGLQVELGYRNGHCDSLASLGIFPGVGASLMDLTEKCTHGTLQPRDTAPKFLPQVDVSPVAIV